MEDGIYRAESGLLEGRRITGNRSRWNDGYAVDCTRDDIVTIKEKCRGILNADTTSFSHVLLAID